MRFEGLLLAAELTEELFVLHLELVSLLPKNLTIVGEVLLQGELFIELPVPAAIEVHSVFELLQLALIPEEGGLEWGRLLVLVNREKICGSGVLMLLVRAIMLQVFGIRQ